MFGIGLAVALSVTSVDAQSSITVNRGSFAVVPFAGYLISQNFVEGPLNSTLGNVNSAVYGVQASLPLAPSASLVGTIGYSSGDLKVGLPIIGGIGVGDSNTLLMDAAVELRGDGWATSFVPFAQLGGGAIRRDFNVAGFKANTTDFQVSLGVGADFPISSNMAIRVMAKDYYGKADFGSIGGYRASTDDLHSVALTGGLSISF